MTTQNMSSVVKGGKAAYLLTGFHRTDILATDCTLAHRQFVSA